eukprot:1286774-Amphidinium_carterae.1
MSFFRQLRDPLMAEFRVKCKPLVPFVMVATTTQNGGLVVEGLYPSSPQSLSPVPMLITQLADPTSFEVRVIASRCKA